MQLLFSEDMAAAFARAVNDWMAGEWLDRDPRLRASIVVPIQNVELAVDEIERCAHDPRFVQVLLLASGDHPLGKRVYWPIYAAAERHGLPIGIHAGSNYHNPPTAVGWPSYYTEDYVAQAQAFQSQLTSLICEGVFNRHPDAESRAAGIRLDLAAGASLAADQILARPADGNSLGRSLAHRYRAQQRAALAAADRRAAGSPPSLQRIIEHMQSDELLLFSTDYPHWQFDGMAALPDGLSPELVRKITVDNPRATYARLLEPVR